jgi:Protein of unknown function (DUF3309)
VFNGASGNPGAMMLYTVLMVLLVCLIVGALPNFGVAPHGWGYGPSGLLGVLLVVLLVLVLTHTI